MSKSNGREIHRLYGDRQPQMPVPKLIIEGRISTGVRPKRDVVVVSRETYTERDGKRFVNGPGGEALEIPAESRVVFAGDKVDESNMDIVVAVEALYAEPSVLMPNGQTKAVVVSLRELARIDFKEFMKRAKAAHRGNPGVPGFVEVEGEWTDPTPEQLPEPSLQS